MSLLSLSQLLSVGPGPSAAPGGPPALALGWTLPFTDLPLATEMAAVLALGVLLAVGWLLMVVKFTRNLRRPAAPGSPERSQKLLLNLRRVAWSILVAGAITVLIAGGGVGLQFVGEEQSHRLRLLNEIQRAAIAESHVWLEEALEGDQGVDLERDVFRNLAQARTLCRESMELTTESRLQPWASVTELTEWLPEDTRRLCERMDQLAGVAERRVANPAESGAGSPADQEYDAAYREVSLAQARLQESLNLLAAYYRRFSLITGAGLLSLLCLLGAAAIAVAMTARRAIEHDLIDLQRLASIVHSSSDAIFSGGLDGTILNWNAGAERIFGYTAAEVVGRPITVLLPPERSSYFEGIRRSVELGEFADGLQTEWMTKQGVHVVVSLTTSPIRDSSGQITSVSVVARDITRHKRAEEELRASNERYRLVGMATHDIIWDMDVLRQTILWGEGICSVFGYERDSIRSDADWWLERIHPEDRDEVFAGIVHALEGDGKSWNGEYRFRRAGGTYASILSRGYILRDERGVALRVIGSITDMTERKREEQELIRAKVEAERANRAKSEFLSRMSHELRTPMNSVLGFALLLRRNTAGALGEQEMLYVDRLLANGRHLLQLINELLDLSRIEAGRTELEVAPLSVGDLVREVLEQLQGEVRDRPVQLFADLPAGMAPIESDAVKFRQILVNLVGNAIKFTPRGSVRVSVVMDPITRCPVRVDVSDTGIGIPSEHLGSIFEPFQQAEQDSARRFGGTGLGLAISKSLAELLGYRITVESERGAGSVFRLVLSSDAQLLHIDSDDSLFPEVLPAVERPAEGEAEEFGDGGTILVVGDDRHSGVQNSLQGLGWWNVIVTGSGERGLELARELVPSLITLSLPLPDMSGWQFLRALREMPELDDVAVVMGSLPVGERPGGTRRNVAILEEPAMRDALLGQVGRLLSAGGARRPAPPVERSAGGASRGLRESETAHV